MCSAVRRRMLVKGMTSSRPGPPVEAVGVAGAVGTATVAVGAAAGASKAGTGAGVRTGGAAPRAITASTSSRVIRPPRPVPVTDDGSMPCSFRSFRTTGDRTSPVPEPAGAGAGAGAGAAAGWPSGVAAAGAAGVAGGAGSAAGAAGAAGATAVASGAAEPLERGAVAR